VQQETYKDHKKIYIALFSVVYLALLVLGLLNLQNIRDYIQNYGYTAPVDVAKLANEDTMTPTTRKLFYLNKPSILNDVASFRKYCSETKNIIVLGCYHTGQNGIYLYQTSNKKLSGLLEVTAAHEVLHSVYERLPNKDKDALNKQLQWFYDNKLSDQNVKAEIALYKKYEPSSVYDEMSCTFGTEIKTLTPDLEKYYSKYFSNRITVYNFYIKYQSKFNDKIAQIYNLGNQLTTIKSQITNNQTKLTSSYNDLVNQQNSLNSLKQTSISQYNSKIPAFNVLVNQYNSLRDSTNSLISQYNSLVDQRNNLITELNTLDKAIDTKVISS